MQACLPNPLVIAMRGQCTSDDPRERHPSPHPTVHSLSPRYEKMILRRTAETQILCANECIWRKENGRKD